MLRIAQIQELSSFKDEPKVLIPVLSDVNLHWVLNRISFIYGYGLTTFQEFIIGFNHNDLPECDIKHLPEFIGEGNFVYHKKNLIDCGLNYEANLVSWFKSNQKLKHEESTVLKWYWNQFSKIKNVNDSIPIMKWLEDCQDLKDKFMVHYNNFELDQSFIKYNQLLDDLAEIERNGLFTN